jgi:hypothetical protein
MYLYLNTRLSKSGVMGQRSNTRPVYPGYHAHIAQNKVEILRLVIKSIRKFEFKKAVINIECEEDFSNELAQLKREIPDILSNVTIINEHKRPSTIDEWKSSTRLLKREFGEDSTVLCMFNHDHVFVEYEVEIARILANRLLAKNKTSYLIYSHTPECISSVFFGEQFNHRLRKWNNSRLDVSQAVHIDSILSYSISKHWVDGIFFTTPLGLEYIWENCHSTVEYIPRPDWPGVTYNETPFLVSTSNRELFRHFDGYGHVTGIPSLLGMNFNEFNETGEFIYRSRISAIYNSMSFQRDNVHELSMLYVRLFKSLHILAIRDVAFWLQETGNKGLSISRALNTLATNLINCYINVDCQLHNIQEQIRSDIQERFLHYLYCEANEIVSTVNADVAFMNLGS